MGIPYQIIIGKNFNDQKIEFKEIDKEPIFVSLEEIIKIIKRKKIKLINLLERKIAFRYLFTKKDGFINIISTFSFLGISLGVAVLIVVMSVMNGFRTELINKINGFNPH